MVEHLCQLAQTANFGIRALITVPRLAARVEPHHAQTCLLRTGNIIARVITHVHGRMGCHAASRQCFMEQPCIGLGNANVLGTEHKFKVVPQANAAYVGIAIGDTPNA